MHSPTFCPTYEEAVRECARKLQDKRQAEAKAGLAARLGSIFELITFRRYAEDMTVAYREKVELTSFLFGVDAMDVYADAEEMLDGASAHLSGAEKKGD